MSEATTSRREQWLEEQITLESRSIELLEAEPVQDEFRQATIASHREILAELEQRLAELRAGPKLAIRLSGGDVQGKYAPGPVIDTVISKFGTIADEFEAGYLVAPSTEGSHVINLVSNPQLAMDLGDEPDPFIEAAGALIGFAPATYPADADRADVVRDRAGDLTDDAFSAVRTIVETLSKHRINVNLRLDSLARTAHVQLDESYMSFLHLELGQMTRKVKDRTVRGTLSGWLTQSGRFEIKLDNDDVISGNVPAKARGMGTGMPIGQRVVAILTETTTTRPGRANRRTYRLKLLDRD